MKNIYLVITIMLLLIGCSGKYKIINPEPSVAIKIPELIMPEPTLYISETSFFKSVVEEESINIKEAPFEEAYFVCGGVYPTQQDTTEFLKNAKTVFVLKGSYEKWTPIEGKSKKYLVFKLQ